MVDSLNDWRSLYPFASRFLELDGHRLHYVDEGTGSQPIVCIHGNPTWSFYYRSLIHGLAPQERVLALDHLGCGLSDKPQNYPYSLAAHTQNLVAWLDHLDLRQVLLVVHDWGGAIGLGAAIQRPSRIQKLLILNTGAFPPPYVPLRIAACRIPWLGSTLIRNFNGFAWPATFMAIHRLKRLDPAVKQGLLFPYQSAADRVAIDHFVRDIPLTTRHPTFSTLQSLEHHLPSLANLPTQLVWGMKDWCFRPECLRKFQQLLPQAHVRQLDDVGHYVMEEAPNEVLDAARSLLSAQSPPTPLVPS